MLKNKSSKQFGNFYDGQSIPFQVRVFERQSNEWHIPIGDVIDNQLDLEQGVAALYAAEENDQVVIHLNCDGGSVDSGDSFLYAMGKCKAPIHVIVSGRAASLATFILLEADSYEISPFATILCHSASYGSAGKMADTLQHAEFTFKQCEKMLRHYYHGFLTNEEIDRIIHQKYEMYMDAQEFTERYENRNKLMEAEIKEEVEKRKAGLVDSGKFLEDAYDDDPVPCNGNCSGCDCR